MAGSLLTALVISIFYQQHSFMNALQFIMMGFSLPSTDPLFEVIQGGGLISMALPAVIVLTSCMMAEVIYGAHFLDPVIRWASKCTGSFRRFGYAMLTSIITAAFGGNQTVAIVFTTNIMKDAYRKLPDFQERLALDLEDSVVVIAALIPWNIAAMFPTTVLQVDRAAYLPFAFYIYLLPLCSLWLYWCKDKKDKMRESRS